MKPIAISFQELDALVRWHETMMYEYIDKDCHAEARQHRERGAYLEFLHHQAQNERQAEITNRLRDTAAPDENAKAQQRSMHHDAILSELHGKKMG